MSADEDPFDDIFGDFESGESGGHPKREAVAQGGLSEGGFVGDGDAVEDWGDFDQGEITATESTIADLIPVDDNTDEALDSVGRGGHATAVEKSTNPEADLTEDDSAEVVEGDDDQGKFTVADRKGNTPDPTPIENDNTDEEWGNFDQVETTVVGEKSTTLETIPVLVEDNDAGEKGDSFDKVELTPTDEKSTAPGLIPVHVEDDGGTVGQGGLAAVDEKSTSAIPATTVTINDNSADEDWGIFVQDRAATDDECISPESAPVPVEDDKAEEKQGDVDRGGEAAAVEKITGHDSVPATEDDAKKEWGDFGHGGQSAINEKSEDSEAGVLPVEDNNAEEEWGDFDQGGQAAADEKITSENPVLVNDKNAEEGLGDFDLGGEASTDEKTTSQDPVLVNDEDTEEGWGDFDQGGQASSNEKSMEPLPAPVEDGNAGGEWGNFDQAEIVSADEQSPIAKTVPVPVPVENGDAEEKEGNVDQGEHGVANENGTGQDPVPANDDDAEEEWGDFDQGELAAADDKSTGQDPVLVNDDEAEEEWGDFDQEGQAAANEKSTGQDLAPLPEDDANAEEEWGNFDQAEVATADEKNTSMDIVPAESDREWGNFDQGEQTGADGKNANEEDNAEGEWDEFDEEGGASDATRAISDPASSGIGNGEEEDWGDFGDAEINETDVAEPKLKPQDFGAESFQIGGSNDEADEWGDFAEENEEMAVLGADDKEDDGDWGDFGEEEQAPKIQTIFDLDDMKFRSVLDRIFSKPVDAVDITKDHEFPDDFVPTPMSFLDDLLKSGQGRSSDGLLFWGPSKCSACSSLLRFLSKSCLVCGKSTGMVDWKGKGRVGPTVESKLRAALRLPKGSILELDDTDSKEEDQFSSSLTPKRNVPQISETSKGGVIPSLDIGENMSRESDERISSLYDVSHNSSEVHAAGKTDLFGAFQSGSSPARGASANDVFSTFIGKESPVQRSGAKDEPVVDLLSQTLADFGFESSTTLSAPSTKGEDETQESALDSVLKVLKSVPKRGDSGTKLTGCVDGFPQDIQDLVDQINVPIFMLSNVLVLPNDAKQEDYFAGVDGEHDVHDGERSPGLLLGMKPDTNQPPQDNIEGMSAPFAMMESLRQERVDEDGLASMAEPQGLVKLSGISQIASDEGAFSLNEKHESLTGDTALKLNGDEPINSVPAAFGDNAGADWGDFTTPDPPKESMVSTLTGEEDSATSDTAEPDPFPSALEGNTEAEGGEGSTPIPLKADVIEMAKLVGENIANDTAGPNPVPSILEDGVEAEWGKFSTPTPPKGDMIEMVKNGGEDTATSMPRAVEENAEAEWGDFTSSGLQNEDFVDITTGEHEEIASSTNESSSAPIAIEDNEEAEWGDFATSDS